MERKPSAADNRAAGKRPAVGRFYRDAVAAVFEIRHGRVGDKFDRAIRPAGVEQNVMHVDAMHDDVRIFEACAERRPGRDAEQILAVERIHQQQRLRKIGDRFHLLAETETIEDVENVRAELDAVADGAKLRRALEYANGAAALRQRERRREAA